MLNFSNFNFYILNFYPFFKILGELTELSSNEIIFLLPFPLYFRSYSPDLVPLDYPIDDLQIADNNLEKQGKCLQGI